MATIPDFHDVRFPTNISYSAKAGPWFKNLIQTHKSGHENRVVEWAYPKRLIELNHSIKNQTEFDLVKLFYYARQGRRFAFRVQDPTDYRTNTDGRTPTVIGVGDTVTTVFQMFKIYSDAAGSFNYIIYKPVSGTVTVWLGPIQQVAGFTLDLTLGTVTFAAPPGAGIQVRVYCEYDVPCRFNTDVFAGTYQQFNNMNWNSIPLIEVRAR